MSRLQLPCCLSQPRTAAEMFGTAGFDLAQAPFGSEADRLTASISRPLGTHEPGAAMRWIVRSALLSILVATGVMAAQTPASQEPASVEEILKQLQESIDRTSKSASDTLTASTSALNIMLRILSDQERQRGILVLTEFSRKPDEERYVLAAMASSKDLCATNMMDCHDLPYETVKPLLSMALERQKATEQKASQQRAFFVSLGSLLVSALSLVISFLAYRHKARAT